MAAIIKNQILKHLSRYAKNLSADKISLSTLRGEGELMNLELDEAVLTDLLALPTWMKLTQAHCNRALIRIQWTKLKSIPIHLNLDEVSIRIETCQELRQGNVNSQNMFADMGKYGFANKVVDGITVTVNSVEITFHSQAFESKVQISRIRVESRSPQWKRVELAATRLKDVDRGEMLLFKAMEWQTLRLEARSTSDRHLAPLRLLTNQARAHIVIKKRLIDCQVVSCRLSLILDDLLWVLTDSQILAAMHFMSSLSGLIKQATEMSQRFKAARKLESLPEYQAQLSQTNALQTQVVIPNTPAARLMAMYDIKETSYHFLCDKIDLHFCDDPGSGRSSHVDLKDGGALQLSLTQVNADFYPYHLARGDRRSWPKYSDNSLAQWLHQSLTAFRIGLVETVSASSLHSPLARTQNQTQSPSSQQCSDPFKIAVTNQLAKLMSTCLVLKIQDFRLFKVTTSSKREVPQPFISSYIERPRDLPTIHAEFSWFYYPDEVSFPLPSPKIYAFVHPIQIHLDVCTILWLNSFVSNLENAMASTNSTTEPDYVDVRLELIMPKVVFENTTVYPSQKERPQSVHFQVARMVVSNFRSNETGTIQQLTQCLDLLQRGDLAFGADFPSENNDAALIAEKFLNHVDGRDNARPVQEFRCSSFQEMATNLTKNMLWTESRDVWYMCMDPFWADFRVETKRKSKQNQQKDNQQNAPPPQKKYGAHGDTPVTATLYPFIDSMQVAAWVHFNEQRLSDISSSNQNGKTVPDSEIKKQKKIHALFHANGLCNVQLTHSQFLFLMRMVEALSELSLYLTMDLEKIVGSVIRNNIFTFLGFIPTVEASLLFPPLVPEKPQDSPSMDLDSIIPESSSGENGVNERDDDNQWKLIERERERKSSMLSASAPTSVPLSISGSPVSNPSTTNDPTKSIFVQGMKHGFSSSLAVSFNKCGVSTPDSEVASQWSNLSSSSSENNFIQIEALEGDGPSSVISIDENVEVAVEVVEDNDRSPSPCYSQDNVIIRADCENLVGVLTIHLDGIEVAQEAKGLDSTIKLQCRSVALKESTGMSWNDFQAKFSARNRKWASQQSETNVGFLSPTQKRAVKLRMTQNISSLKFEEILASAASVDTINRIKTPQHPRINLADKPGSESPIRQALIDANATLVDVRIDLRNEEEFLLHMSSIVGLTDFFEDEIIPAPIPLQIEVIGLSIELIEDRPSVNIGSPGPVPIKLCIPNFLPITRDLKGIFHIGLKGYGTEPRLEKDDTDTLRAELEKCLKQLELSKKHSADLANQAASTQDLKCMVLQLQEQVSVLQEEKMVLLNKLTMLRSQNNHK